MSFSEEFRENLRKLISGKVLFDERADRHTSLGVGGEIDALAYPPKRGGTLPGDRLSPGDPDPLSSRRQLDQPDRDGPRLPGGPRFSRRLCALKLKDGREGGISITAGAGASLSEVVRLCVKESLTGMEFCAGIPGSVGGAVRMNAGAYGGEIKDIVDSVHFLDPEGRTRTEPRDLLRFRYRSLDLPAESIIIGTVFRLRQGEKEKIAARVRELIETRKEKHPLEFRNAGSVFKNPRDFPAGRLIEKAGLKGTRIGDAQVSEKHGNFIVNRGQAKAEELLGLIALVQKRVLDATGHTLELEVKIIGEQ